MRRILLSAALVAGALMLWPTGQVVSQQVRQVLIANFPDSQEIHGTVAVNKPIPAAVAFRREEVVVPPIDRLETGALIDGGVLETAGFTTVDLSLQGEVRGTQPRDGEVGAILLPDEPAVLRAFLEGPEIQFSLEVDAPINAQTVPFVDSEQIVRSIGFPRYRIFFYNTSNRTVEVNLYGYLKH